MRTHAHVTCTCDSHFLYVVVFLRHPSIPCEHHDTNDRPRGFSITDGVATVRLVPSSTQSRAYAADPGDRAVQQHFHGTAPPTHNDVIQGTNSGQIVVNASRDPAPDERKPDQAFLLTFNLLRLPWRHLLPRQRQALMRAQSLHVNPMKLCLCPVNTLPLNPTR